mmetsp:Transcript_20451/g.24851  ORF Transcript_20451/g.24851 Transcript_20451/m.24851 type:complete len:382 (+) Transcript_20451:414-1559(+)
MARTRLWQKEWRCVIGDEVQIRGPSVKVTSRSKNKNGMSFGSLGRMGFKLDAIREGDENNSHHSNVKLGNITGMKTKRYVRSSESISSLERDFESASSYSTLRNDEEQFSMQEFSPEDYKFLILQLLDWISTVTKQQFTVDPNLPLVEIVTQSFGNGEVLVEMLRFVGLLNLSWAVRTFGKPPSKVNNYEERLGWNFKVFKIICTNIGVPVEFQLCAQDCHMQVLEVASVRKIIACIALVTRFCTQKGIDPCDIPIVTLRSLGVPMHILTTRPIQKLQEMSSKGSFWVPNDFSDNCLLCEEAFSAFNWRHHCRKCGILCCGSCSRYRSRCQGYSTPQRVCLCCASDDTALHFVQDGNTLLNVSTMLDSSFQQQSRLNMTIM